IDREYVAFLQSVIGWKPMHDLLIHGRANRVRKTVVALERWIGARVANHLFRRMIDFDSRNAGLDHRPEFLQDTSDQLAGGAHLVNLLLRLADDHLLS